MYKLQLKKEKKPIKLNGNSYNFFLKSAIEENHDKRRP